MNKYQDALNTLCHYEIAYKVDCEKPIELLEELIEKYEKVCLELQNASFMDDQCKLITLDIIKGIIKG